MTVTALTVGSRFAIAGLAAAGSLVFALFAFGPPVSFLTQGAPVHPSWAALAWTSPLAGFPMAALALFALAAGRGVASGQDAWEALAHRCLTVGLAGFGVCAFLAGAALGGALALYGRPTVHSAGDGLVLPMVAILLGLSCVVAVNLVRMWAGGAWTALGHILWGFLGVVALTIGVPMSIDAVTIDDGRTLAHRFNFLIVIYPVLWLAFAAAAAAVVICGLRWLRFGLAQHQRSEVNPPSTGKTWPVTYDDSPEIRNKAA